VSFRDAIARIAPFLKERVEELRDWDQVKLLTVQINHLRRWYRPGLLCIGDAAHAMSPAGGVGINYAIQDAIATARILAPALSNRESADNLLVEVQRRRELPVRVMQIIQKQAHVGFARIFDNAGPLVPPWQFKLAVRVPGLQRLMGRLIGIGIRPEHVRQQPRNPLLIGIASGLGAAVGVLVGQRLANCRSGANCSA
jgi:2-polyprenyl-6-methoxyphenol hydroxylase-like FAD-dependent oxidoreductase